jgi:hypothetical protein
MEATGASHADSNLPRKLHAAAASVAYKAKICRLPWRWACWQTSFGRNANVRIQAIYQQFDHRQ